MTTIVSDADFTRIQLLWRNFFPNDMEPANKEDQRVRMAQIFFAFFSDERHGKILLSKTEWASEGSVYLDAMAMKKLLPFADFIPMLREKPIEIMGAMGLSFGLIADKLFPYSDPFVVHPRMVNLDEDTPFDKLKTAMVGQLVSIVGYAIRVSPSRVLVERAEFICPSCNTSLWVRFEDSIFQQPDKCPKKCGAKFYEKPRLNRGQAKVTVYQRIKLQELDRPRARGSDDHNEIGDEQSRVPRTFDIEARGQLVNKCSTGCIFQCVGILKAEQVPSRGRRNRDTALSNLYILANTLKAGLSSCSSSPSPPNSAGLFLSSQASCAPTQQERDPPEDMALSRADVEGHSRTYDDSSSGGDGNRNNGTNSGEDFTESELSMIRNTSALGPECLGVLVSSLCPNIFGQDVVKMGLLLGLMGGTKRDSDPNTGEEIQGVHVRSDIHVLVVGDPGLGKSQLLRAAAASAPRSVLVCANTSTTAGLTVAVTKEAGGHGDVILEAGALVLADLGVCCIDELDKISCDYRALLEAMEQQSVSVAKSGMVTSVRTRAAVLAAANPCHGHYNRNKSVYENLKMPSSLLSRFDLVFIIMDKLDAQQDKMISEHIMKTHALAGASKKARNSSGEAVLGEGARVAGAEEEADPFEGMTISQRLRRQAKTLTEQKRLLSQEQLRRYIEYARRYVHPWLSPGAAKVLQRMYLTMRLQAVLGKSIPVTLRNLESLIRLAQARARCELREDVTEQDALDVVEVMHESLLDAFTSESGTMELFSKSGKMGGTSKQVKALVQALKKEAELRDSKLFHTREIKDTCRKLKLEKDPGTLIEKMYLEGYLLMKPNKSYELSYV